jgi:hypothetical protein
MRYVSNAMPVNRRHILQGGIATLCCGTQSATAVENFRYRGCTLTSSEMVIQAGPNPAPVLYHQGSVVVRGSGNDNFDRALAVSLKMLSETFSVLPGFAFSERVIRNAFASPSTAMGRQDGSVIFGNSLYREIMNGRENPEVGILTVCAHEFGHIVQYKYGIDERLVACDDCPVKRLELHADFLAGYFAGRRKLERADFPAAVFAKTQYNFGDNNYGSPRHHGSQQERGQAVVAGFNSAFRDQHDFKTALEVGVNYVQRIPLTSS